MENKQLHDFLRPTEKEVEASAGYQVIFQHREAYPVKDGERRRTSAASPHNLLPCPRALFVLFAQSGAVHRSGRKRTFLCQCVFPIGLFCLVRRMEKRTGRVRTSAPLLNSRRSRFAAPPFPKGRRAVNSGCCPPRDWRTASPGRWCPPARG